MISNNDRISVSHDETRAKFRLHINNVTLEDAGPYMCQINSMPVKLQVSTFILSYRGLVRNFNLRVPLLNKITHLR